VGATAIDREGKVGGRVAWLLSQTEESSRTKPKPGLRVTPTLEPEPDPNPLPKPTLAGPDVIPPTSKPPDERPRTGA